MMRSQDSGVSDIPPREGDAHLLRETATLAASHQSPHASPALQRPQSASGGSLASADQAAVEATNSGAMTWKDAHEQWLSRTQRELSPGAFGKRIVALGGGRNPKKPTPLLQNAPLPPPAQAPAPLNAPPPSSIPPSVHRTLPPMNIPLNTPAWMSNNPPEQSRQGPPMHMPVQVQTPPAVGVNTQPSHEVLLNPTRPITRSPSMSMQDSLERQRRDIMRIDNAVKHLHDTMEDVVQQVESLRQELRRRPIIQASGDGSPLDVLTESLSVCMTKTAEVDSLKMQIGVLQRRMKRLEDGPNPAEQGAGQSINLQVPPGSAPMTVAWQAANANTAKRHLSDASQQSDPKRLKTNEGEVIVLEPGLSQNYSAATPGGAASPYFSHSHQGSPDVWQSAIQPLSGYHQGTKRGPGRPRKFPLNDLHGHTFAASQQTPTSATPQTWSSTQPNENAVWDAMDYSGVPGSSDRGLLIRRGNSAYAGAYVISPDGRRTRQKPIRNEQGVLIRKDGKPDRRSQTSAENLRRVMNRRAEEQAQAQRRESQGGTEAAGGHEGLSASGAGGLGQADGVAEEGESVEYEDSQADGEVDVEGSDMETAVSGGGDNQESGAEVEVETSSAPQASAQPTGLTSTAAEAAAQPSTPSAHPEVMRKMFPHGLPEEARRLDLAGQLFRTDSPSSAVREKPAALMAPRSEAESAAATTRPDSVMEVEKEEEGVEPEVETKEDVVMAE